MSIRKSLLACLALGVPSIGAAAEGVAIVHSEPLYGYRVAARAAAAKPLTADTPEIRFNAFGRDFTLELERNARLAAMQASLDLAPGIVAYRGKLAGRPDSWVRLVLTPAGPAGIVFDGGTFFAIEVGGDSVLPDAGSAPPVMFRLADVYVAPGAMSCGATESTDGAQALAAMLTELTPLAAQGATLNLDIGAVADFEFTTAFGANAQSALLTRFNNIDGIFSEQVGVQISVAEVSVFANSNDPFVATGASALLDELATYRGATAAQDAQGLTHMFTGRDLDGSTAGIAFVGALCSQRSRFDPRSFGVGLSEGRRGATIDSLIAAHEIGHNFGAPHDTEAGSACAATPATFLMAPSISGVDQFSACSIAQMQPEIAAAGCLTPIGSANVAITTTPQARAVLTGITFDHVFTVANVGVNPATGVTVNATVAPGLELLSATANATTCTLGTQTLACPLGTIGGGASRQLTLSLRAAQVGAFDVTAAVTADADASASDNTQTATVTAAALVDLVLSGGSGSVQTSQQTTVVANLENAADFAATAVALTATLSAGLRPDQASVGGTPCAIAGQTVTCPPRTLAARGTVALTVSLTGLTGGEQHVSVSAAAVEAERTPTNNQLAIAVAVSAPAAEEGGGGALAWWVVALLGVGRGLQRRRSNEPA